MTRGQPAPEASASGDPGTSKVRGFFLSEDSGNLALPGAVYSFREVTVRAITFMATDGRSSWSKWVAVLIVLGAIAGGAAWYLKSRQEPPPEYLVVAVTRGDLTQAVTATGQLAPVLNVQVGSQISGIVRKLYADFNSVVKSNQVVAEIDPSTYEIGVLKAQAQLANSKANLALAEVQARRAGELFENKLISGSDHDTAQAQLLQAQAQVQIDEANLKTANVQLSYCKIYAPVDGVVITRSVDVGQTVAASFNTPTLFLMAGDLSKMQIDALVSEADIGGVATNQDVTFTVDAYPFRSFSGKVSQIRYGSITNQNVINYDCVISLDNSDLKLLPGMTANVSIILAQRTDTLKVPNAALRFRPPEVAGATNAAAQTMAQGRGPGGNGSGDGGGVRPGGPGRGAGQGRPGANGMAPGEGRRGDRGSGEQPGGAGRRPRSERQLTRTIYVLPATSNSKDPADAKPKPVQIKVGISDGISTEVLEGLEEGARVVTGVIAAGDAAGGASGRAAPNPFGGGGGMRRF